MDSQVFKKVQCPLPPSPSHPYCCSWHLYVFLFLHALRFEFIFDKQYVRLYHQETVFKPSTVKLNQVSIRINIFTGIVKHHETCVRLKIFSFLGVFGELRYLTRTKDSFSECFKRFQFMYQLKQILVYVATYTNFSLCSNLYKFPFMQQLIQIFVYVPTKPNFSLCSNLCKFQFMQELYKLLCNKYKYVPL